MIELLILWLAASPLVAVLIGHAIHAGSAQSPKGLSSPISAKGGRA